MPDDEPHVPAVEAPAQDAPAPGALPQQERGAAPDNAINDRANALPPRAATTLGAYTIWVADKVGKLIDPLKDRKVRDKEPNPSDPDAVDIYYVLEDSTQLPPEEQVELQLNIDKVLRAATRLYLERTPVQMDKFRVYFVRLFRIAQLGMEGQNAVPGVAKGALTAVTADLIDDEAGRIKNGHMIDLGLYAAAYSLVCFALYSVIKLFRDGWFGRALDAMQVDPTLLANFAVLWIGCFIGVWLSYGIRKSTFTLVDLTRAEEDRLAPNLRLIFAGLLATIVGLLFALKFVEVKIGNVSSTEITSRPMLVFLVGLFCGISELALPASIGTRAQSFVNSLK